eukprot:TRINITY_DN14201_c0_g1_i1.p1 TRINITY_DN14201_c0_g1~~TRINITY_DN14201_c0_g1_i1.p1  ORF type:complete len:407 (+),score=144.46 TRINITY_DN14201_c0_g1_i1:100-1320(+)
MSSRGALRRRSSFHKMDTVMEDTERWFHTDPALAEALDGFAERHCCDFAPQPGGPHSDAASGEAGWFIFAPHEGTVEAQSRLGAALHLRKALFDSFTEIFDAQLDAWLTSRRVSQEEFQQVFRIAQAEEERRGLHFYRWHQVGSYPVWLQMMFHAYRRERCGEGTAESPCQWLRRHVLQLSSEARVALRRRKALCPLLDLWRPSAFEELRVALLHPDCPPLGSERARQKLLLRWQHLCSEPVPGEDGVCRPPPLRPGRLAGWLSLASGAMPDAEFDRFLAHLQRTVQVLPPDPARRRRAAAQEVLSAVDRHWNGDADIRELQRAARKLPRYDTKAHRKLFARWEASLRDGPESTRPLVLDEVANLVEELAAAGDAAVTDATDPAGSAAYHDACAALAAAARKLYGD